MSGTTQSAMQPTQPVASKGNTPAPAANTGTTVPTTPQPRPESKPVLDRKLLYIHEALSSKSYKERFFFNSPNTRVGHAFIYTDPTTSQLKAHQEQTSAIQDFGLVKNISLLSNYGGLHAEAQFVDTNKRAFADFSVQIKVIVEGQHTQGELFFFTECATQSHQWKSTRGTGTYNGAFQLAQDKKNSAFPEKITASKIIPHNIYHIKKSKMNTVIMGKPARQCLSAFKEDCGDLLPENILRCVNKTIKAHDKTSRFMAKRFHQAEWLHVKAEWLCSEPKSSDSKANLGSATAWLNTQMMIAESVTYHHTKGLHEDGMSIFHAATFSMAPTAPDVINAGEIKSTIRINNTVMVAQHLNPWQAMPHLTTINDIQQTVLVTNKLAHCFVRKNDKDVTCQDTINEDFIVSQLQNHRFLIGAKIAQAPAPQPESPMLFSSSSNPAANTSAQQPVSPQAPTTSEQTAIDDCAPPPAKRLKV